MLFIYILILLASFYVLAKVVDDYFVDSLDYVAERLKMSHDAAGATLMAIGSSAPELFVAIFAVIRPDGNHEAIGIGNIVGSALFNILVITGAAAIVRKAFIAWQGVVRDLVFYAISVVLLLLTLADGKVSYAEASILIAVYLIYVLVVVYWRKMFKYNDPDEKITVKETDENKELKLYEKIMSPLDFILKKIFPPAKYNFAVFFMSIAIIAGISWVLVESAIHIARILNISEAIIAVTVLAVGTSIPDLLSSLIVSKQGRGGMAISNAVGSNIFDILIGLGLPFMIIILTTGGKASLDIGNIEQSVYFLLVSVVIVFLLFVINKWKVGKIFGSFLIVIYLAYVVWVIITV
ncbi:MAG: calcium/sodium antiporter [Bacteroidales bacterium]|nr:calcium/sodium antiporter [Bacteroidales bacterium]